MPATQTEDQNSTNQSRKRRNSGLAVWLVVLLSSQVSLNLVKQNIIASSDGFVYRNAPTQTQENSRSTERNNGHSSTHQPRYVSPSSTTTKSVRGSIQVHTLIPQFSQGNKRDMTDEHTDKPKDNKIIAVIKYIPHAKTNTDPRMNPTNNAKQGSLSMNFYRRRS